jgi:toxin ParE1/3/4
MRALVDKSIAQLGVTPLLGRRSRQRGVRELVIPRTPFIAVYRVDAEEIVILRFFHGRQKR